MVKNFLTALVFRISDSTFQDGPIKDHGNQEEVVPLFSALRRQRQVDLCEFEVRLVYRVFFQDTQGYTKLLFPLSGVLSSLPV